MAAIEFPVAFIFVFHDYEASQALAYCHDEEIDILDFYQHGHNVIGFYLYSAFEKCKEFCQTHDFDIISYTIYSVNI